VRGGIGLLAAVEIAPEHLRGGATVSEVFQAARERGVIVRPLASGLALSPPLIVTPEEIALAARTLGEALDAVLAVH
jgi:putrescine aminotransferase